MTQKSYIKTFGMVALIAIGIYFIAKNSEKPTVVILKNSTGTVNCTTPNLQANGQNTHQGCCIGSGRAAYILGKSNKTTLADKKSD